MMHRDCTLADIANGEARIVRCADCGQMEIWSYEEWSDHGQCRCGPRGVCHVCEGTDDLAEEEDA